MVDERLSQFNLTFFFVLVVGNPTRSWGVESRWSLRSFSTQVILFYDNLREKFFSSEPANSVNILPYLRDSDSTFISIAEQMPFIEPWEDIPTKYRVLSALAIHLPEPSLYSCS